MPNTFTSRQRKILGGILCLGVLIQAAILITGQTGNILQRVPQSDAQVYWDWGGDIARGKLVADTPFMSAPLYPYIVGLVRALGGGLAWLFALQALLHVATAALIARIGARRFSVAVGLTAAALYLVLLDPAFFTGRVLNCTLQAFACVWLWERALLARERATLGNALALGTALGFAVLSNPTFVPLVVLLPLWLWWSAGRQTRHSVAAFVVALVCIAPATLHNWLASRELILTSAQAGLGFYHGNQPGAEGIYRAAEGVSTDRTRQTLDARDAVRAETDGSWKQTSGVYFRRGLSYWAEDLPRALALCAKKLWWFASGRVYGDVYVPVLEREDGAGRWLWLASLPVAWLTLPALVALFYLLRRPLEHAPEILLFGLTLAVVASFWYSPRYRLPAVPLIAVFAAWTLCEIVKPTVWSAARARALGVASIVLSIAAAVALERSGRDSPGAFRAQYEHALGSAWSSAGELQEALTHYRYSEHLGLASARAASADVLRRLGRSSDALAELHAAVVSLPNDAYVRRSLGVAQAESGMYDEARSTLEATLRLDPNDWETLSNLGNVLLALGDAAGAVERHRQALALNPSFANAHHNRASALVRLGRASEAEADWRAALRIDPAHAPARAALADHLLATRRYVEGVRELRQLQREHPGEQTLAVTLAWWLATSPDAEARDGRAALALLEPLAAAHQDDAQFLDTWAAVQAELGQFSAARTSAERALQIVRRDGPEAVIPELQARLDEYIAGRAFRQ